MQQLYEKQMHDPPLPRNMPPVAGNIAWARHLYKARTHAHTHAPAVVCCIILCGLWCVSREHEMDMYTDRPTRPHHPLQQRIEAPMQQFERNQNVLAGKEARRIIRLYNKIAQTLVTFELRWHEAWVASVERAKSGGFGGGVYAGVLNMRASVCVSTPTHLIYTSPPPPPYTQGCTPPSSCGTPTTAGCT